MGHGRRATRNTYVQDYIITYLLRQIYVIAVTAIQDMCHDDQIQTLVANNNGYLATPGYPKSLQLKPAVTSCTTNVITQTSESAASIHVYILDTLSYSSSSPVSSPPPSAQCVIKLEFIEANITDAASDPKVSRSIRMAVCLENKLYRNDLLYSSKGGQLTIKFAVDDVTQQAQLSKGLLLYYEGTVIHEHLFLSSA